MSTRCRRRRSQCRFHCHEFALAGDLADDSAGRYRCRAIQIQRVREQREIVAARKEFSEGAAAIDPELKTGLHGSKLRVRIHER